MTHDEILKYVENEVKLPVMPTVAAKVVEEAKNPMATADSFGKIILFDQALAARILNIANSVCYRRAIEVENLADAIVRIGLKRIKDLAVGLSSKALFEGSSPLLQELWERSIATALATQALGEVSNKGHDAFIAGLLHNVGKVVLHNLDPDRFEKTIEKSHNDQCSDCEAETELFKVNHPEVAAAIMTKWQMEPDLIDAIRWYVDYDQNPDLSSKARGVAQVVNLANKIVSTHNIAMGSFAEPTDFAEDPTAIDMDVNPKQIDDIAEKTKELFEEERSLFG